MTNKKVLIITMHRIINYGSALQAWALQESIKKMGFDAQLIDYRYPNDYYFNHCKCERFSFITFLKKITLKRVLSVLKYKILYQSKKQRKLFYQFWLDNFSLTKEYISPDDLKNNPPIADVYITGSDQVWNPNTMYGDPAFFLDFGSSLIPRISYAASFGTNVIPDEYEDEYIEYINKYKSLSIRENTGVEIVKKLTGRDSTLVCDPTLLLTKEDYGILASSSTIKIDKPYLLAYILDYAYNPRPAIDHIIKQVSKKLGLHVVYLLCGNVNGYKPGSTTVSAVGPNEFTRLFQDASFVVTSSFHGTVFSLINEKPFYAITSAEKVDSRISSLLQEVGLIDRGIPANQLLDKRSLVLNIDYALVRSEVLKIRKNSMDYLKHSLNIQ